MKGECAFDIRELVQPSAAFVCEMCGENIFRAGKFRWKSRSLVTGYEARTLMVYAGNVFTENHLAANIKVLL